MKNRHEDLCWRLGLARAHFGERIVAVPGSAQLRVKHVSEAFG